MPVPVCLSYPSAETKAQHKCIANLYLLHTLPEAIQTPGWLLDHSILEVYFPCCKFKLRL